MAKRESGEPLVSLTEDSKRHLDEMQGELDRAERDVSALDELGLDTARLKERIAWAKKARQVIIDRLGQE